MDRPDGGVQTGFGPPARGAGDHQRDYGERDGGKRILVSDHGQQHADQLRGDGIAGGLVGEQRVRIDLGDADDGGNIDGDAERDQQRGDRQRHPDADHQRSGAGNHQREYGERDGGQRILVSDHGQQHADQLRGDGFAGGLVGEQHVRIDLGDADDGRRHRR